MISEMESKQRLASLDALRGLTIAGMILVNNAGGRESYAALRHSVWDGLTPCDLVFPFFLFIMGVSTYLSLGKFQFRPSGEVLRKVGRRTLLILLLGWGLNLFELLCEGDLQPWLSLRIPGVLQRIALCYGAASLFALYAPHRQLKYWVAGILWGYALLLWLGHGFEATPESILAVVDHRLLGAAHLYKKSPVDPEGLLSTLPAIAHTLIGFLSARLIHPHTDLREKVVRLFVMGFTLMAVGWLLSDAIPLNKRIWSPTYVLVSCGMCASAWAWMMTLIDIRRAGRFTHLFQVFGMNPLALYVLSELLAVVLGQTGMKAVIYQGLLTVIRDVYLASAVYALLYTSLLGGVGWLLYRKRIFIKI
jgi:predicted acyltransferase